MSQDNRTLLEKLKDESIPSMVAGGLGTIASSFLLGVDISQNVKIFNVSMPLYVAITGTIAGADFIAKASHDYVLEKLPALQSIATYENRLATPLISGVSTYALFYTVLSPDVSMVNSMLLGAGSTIAGQYAYDMIENKQM